MSPHERPAGVWPIVLLVAAATCTDASDYTRSDPARPVTVAPRTALVVLQLGPDGGIEITDVVVKPVSYSLPTTHQTRARTVLTAPRSPVGKAHGRGLLLRVRDAQGKRSVDIPIALGQPGEGGGDVADRWQGGTVVVRVPHFDAATDYEVIDTGAPGGHRVAATRSRP